MSKQICCALDDRVAAPSDEVNEMVALEAGVCSRTVAESLSCLTALKCSTIYLVLENSQASSKKSSEDESRLEGDDAF